MWASGLRHIIRSGHAVRSKGTLEYYFLNCLLPRLSLHMSTSANIHQKCTDTRRHTQRQQTHTRVCWAFALQRSQAGLRVRTTISLGKLGLQLLRHFSQRKPTARTHSVWTPKLHPKSTTQAPRYSLCCFGGSSRRPFSPTPPALRRVGPPGTSRAQVCKGV